jgi:hypothetical protein
MAIEFFPREGAKSALSKKFIKAPQIQQFEAVSKPQETAPLNLKEKRIFCRFFQEPVTNRVLKLGSFYICKDFPG